MVASKRSQGSLVSDFRLGRTGAQQAVRKTACKLNSLDLFTEIRFCNLTFFSDSNNA